MPKMKQNLQLRIVASIVALVVAGIHIGMPELRIDSITIVLLVIAAIPWMHPLIKSVELLGVKLELQDLENKVAAVRGAAEDARGAAESAAQQAGLALASSVDIGTVSDLSDTKAGDLEGIKLLAEEYDHIRDSQRSSDARTAAMTSVVRRMIDHAGQVHEFDLDTALHEAGRGLGLFAYVYLYVRPDPEWIIPLVESVTQKEDKPFGQYWGLQAIGRVQAKVAAPGVIRSVKDRLLSFKTKIPAGTDREYMVKKLLQQIDGMVLD